MNDLFTWSDAGPPKAARVDEELDASAVADKLDERATRITFAALAPGSDETGFWLEHAALLRDGARALRLSVDLSKWILLLMVIHGRSDNS